jgi:hypothetical protein
MTGRVCHAIEIAPAYVDVAVKRWAIDPAVSTGEDADETGIILLGVFEAADA